MFLEDYGVDILRLNAPVDGSEVGCSSKVWDVEDIRNELMDALETNTPFIKIQGNYYTIGKKENQYFVKDIGTKADVNVNIHGISERTEIKNVNSISEIMRAITAEIMRHQN